MKTCPFDGRGLSTLAREHLSLVRSHLLQCAKTAYPAFVKNAASDCLHSMVPRFTGGAKADTRAVA